MESGPLIQGSREEKPCSVLEEDAPCSMSRVLQTQSTAVTTTHHGEFRYYP